MKYNQLEVKKKENKLAKSFIFFTSFNINLSYRYFCEYRLKA